jgi:WD40 repeat protein
MRYGTIFLGCLVIVLPGWAAEEPDQPVLRLFEGHRDYVRDVAFSPDGKYLASASRDGSVRLWDVATGKEIRRLADDLREFWAVAYSPDGKYVAASGFSGVLMWEVATGKFVHRFGEQGGELRCLAFSPDGKTLVAPSSGVSFYDVATGKELRRIETSGHAFALSPDGKQLVTGEDHFLDKKRPDAFLHLWDAQTGALLRKFDAPKKPEGSMASCSYENVAFSPDGRVVVSSNTYDGMTRLWNAATGREIATYHALANPRCVLFTPNAGQLLISSSSESFWIVWDIETQRAVRFSGQKSRADRLALSPDGKYVASASPDQTLGLWKLPK